MIQNDIQNQKNKGDRIAKIIARAGVCSRRDAERLIEKGKVRVDGKTLETPAFLIHGHEKIEVNGKVLPRAQKTRLFLYHKPVGLVTSHKDEQGRQTVFDALPKGLPRVISVGRSDLNTEGLLLLTNDGGLSRYLELPATGWKRRYRVRVYGEVDEKKLANLKKGIRIDDVKYKSIDAKVDGVSGTNTWISVVLTEGKNREIRRVMEHLNLQVNRLIRTSYGPFNLDSLGVGDAKEIDSAILHDQIKGYFNA